MTIIPLFKVFMSPEASLNASEVLNSGYITQGSKVEEFENALKEWFQYEYILTLNSATSGLTLAYKLLNIPQGNKVISTPLTCFATNAAILANFLSIKWIDVNKKNALIDIDNIVHKLDPYINAVTVVHWGGYPVDIDALRKKIPSSVTIVEDCAHAFGAEYHGVKLGSHCSRYNSICVFSLQAIKHLTTGDGGLIFLPNKEMYDRAKLLRWYGIDRNYRSKGDFRLEHDISEWGYKFHMNDINASIGLGNLPYMKNNLLKIRNNIAFFDTELKDLSIIKLMKVTNNSLTAGWLYTLRVIGRDKFMNFMKERGIMTSQVHQRNDIHSCTKKFKTYLPNLDQLEKELICIPCGWWLSEDDRIRIVTAIKEWNSILQPRDLELNDYHKGFLTLLKYFNGVDLTYDYSTFVSKYNLCKENIILVIEDNEKRIIATAKALKENKFYENIYHIEDVVIHPEYRNMNLGRYIIKQLVKRIQEDNDYYKIVLNCTEKIKPFYTKLGFVKEGNQLCFRNKNKM